MHPLVFATMKQNYFVNGLMLVNNYLSHLIQYLGDEIHSGMPIYKLQRKATVYKKENTYTLYVTKEEPYKPVRYVMHGYDTLLHSFYDHYVVDYFSLHKWKFNFDVMKIPEGMK